MSRKTKALEFIDDVYSINVTGLHVEVTEAMKAYAIEKISKVERFSNHIIDVQVTMDVQKLEQRVSILLSIDHFKIKCSAAELTMYAAIDKAVDKLESQLRRYRERIRNHRARGVPSIEMNVNVLRPAADEEDINGDFDEEMQRQIYDKYKPHEIVSKEKLSVKNLNYDEAVMKMELSGDSFLIFRFEGDKKLKVIYRRDEDNHYGIIELEA